MKRNALTVLLIVALSGGTIFGGCGGLGSLLGGITGGLNPSMAYNPLYYGLGYNAMYFNPMYNFEFTMIYDILNSIVQVVTSAFQGASGSNT